MIYCRECTFDKPWNEFLDDEGRVSTRCRECREKPLVTPRETPYSRKASGKVSVEDVRRLMRAKQEAELAELEKKK